MSKLSKKQRDLLIYVIPALVIEEHGLTVSEVEDLAELRSQLVEDRETERETEWAGAALLNSMNTGTVKCSISKYNLSIEPPYSTIQIGEIEIEDTDPDRDEGGTVRFGRINRACEELGYDVRFYTLSRKDGYKYNIVVDPLRRR